MSGFAWRHVHCGHDLRGDDPCKQRWNAVSDLPEAMPLCDVEAKPVGIGMQAGGFPNRDDARKKRMYRARRGEGSAGTIGSGTKRIAKARRVELVEAADGFRVALLRGKEPFLGYWGVLGSRAGSQDAVIEHSLIAEV